MNCPKVSCLVFLSVLSLCFILNIFNYSLNRKSLIDTAQNQLKIFFFLKFIFNMKTLIILIVLISGIASAQDNTGSNSNNSVEVDTQNVNDEKKRPSWSQGLPERKTAPTAASLMSKPKSEIDFRPAQESFKPELDTTEIQLNFQPKSTNDFKVEVEPTPIEVSLSREEMRDSFYKVEDDEQEPEVVDSELLAQYKWQVVKVSNVEVPSDFDASEALNLNIHINPKGRVVKVVSEDEEVSSKAMRMIEKSIKKWRFEPPGDLGIAANINKSFNIDIQAD